MKLPEKIELVCKFELPLNYAFENDGENLELKIIPDKDNIVVKDINSEIVGLFVDYAPADECKEICYGCCYKCGKCGRVFEDGVMVDDGGTHVTGEETE